MPPLCSSGTSFTCRSNFAALPACIVLTTFVPKRLCKPMPRYRSIRRLALDAAGDQRRPIMLSTGPAAKVHRDDHCRPSGLADHRVLCGEVGPPGRPTAERLCAYG